MTELQNMAISYINGNISYVKNKIKNGEICILELADELFDMLSTEDYKLFLKRMKG